MNTQPVIIVTRGNMTPKDLTRLRKAGVCVVEATDASQVKYAQMDRNAAAALVLVTSVIGREGHVSWSARDIGHWFARLLIASETK